MWSRRFNLLGVINHESVQRVKHESIAIFDWIQTAGQQWFGAADGDKMAATGAGN